MRLRIIIVNYYKVDASIGSMRPSLSPFRFQDVTFWAVLVSRSFLAISVKAINPTASTPRTSSCLQASTTLVTVPMQQKPGMERLMSHFKPHPVLLCDLYTSHNVTFSAL